MRIPVYSDILPGKVKVLREKNRVFSTSTSRNLKDHLSSNLRRGQSRDHLSLGNIARPGYWQKGRVKRCQNNLQVYPRLNLPEQFEASELKQYMTFYATVQH